MKKYKSQIKTLGGSESFFSNESLNKKVCYFCYFEDEKIAIKTTEALAEIYFSVHKPIYAYIQAVHDLDFICQQLDNSDPKKRTKFQDFYRKAVDYDEKINVNLN